jgi:hypothetical protein
METLLVATQYFQLSLLLVVVVVATQKKMAAMVDQAEVQVTLVEQLISLAEQALAVKVMQVENILLLLADLIQTAAVVAVQGLSVVMVHGMGLVVLAELVEQV